MLLFFKRKTPSERLYQEHDRLLKEAHALSDSMKVEKMAKFNEAEKILRQIYQLELR